MYEQIGHCSEQKHLGAGVYHFDAGCGKNGRLYFKDGEAFANSLDTPCYVPEVDFENRRSLTTRGYRTYDTLLSICHYNERFCKAVFDRLEGQSVAECLSDMCDEGEAAKFWDFVKVGNKVFWGFPDRSFYNIEPDFYEVTEIKREAENFLNWKVMLHVVDICGQHMNAEARMDELSETDVMLKIKKRWLKW